MAVSFSGEQAFEIHIPNTQLYAAYHTLIQVGAEFGLVHFGNYAIESMRIEKGYGHWKADFITEFNPIEAGLNFFVDMSKGFPGKRGLERQMAKGNRRERVLLVLDSTTAPAQSGETVFAADQPVGTITSAAWGYRTKRNLAMAYVSPKHANPGNELEVLLLGESVKAIVVELGLYDAKNAIPRGRRVEES